LISTNDFHIGVTVEVDGDIWSVVDFQHVKPGKGSPFVRAKLKNIRTGNVIERTFDAGEKLPRAYLERRETQFLYEADGQYTFMDTENYEQTTLSREQLGNAPLYLKENMTVYLTTYQGQIVGVELPNVVELKVVETEPGVRGDTATGGRKPAKLETGVVVQVPLFVNEGEVVRVDTRTGEYVERA